MQLTNKQLENTGCSNKTMIQSIRQCHKTLVQNPFHEHSCAYLQNKYNLVKFERK